MRMVGQSLGLVVVVVELYVQRIFYFTLGTK